MLSLKYLEIARERKKMTYAQFAKYLGISERTWRRIRNIPDYQPYEITVKKIEHVQGLLRRSYKHRVKEAIGEFTPVDRNFKVYITLKRCFVPFTVPLRGMPEIMEDELGTDQTERAFVAGVTARVLAHPRSMYMKSTAYNIEYITLRVDFLNVNSGFVFTLPARAQWILDGDYKGAVESAALDILASLDVTLVGGGPSGEGGIVKPLKCGVQLVTRETKAEL